MCVGGGGGGAAYVTEGRTGHKITFRACADRTQPTEFKTEQGNVRDKIWDKLT